MKTNRRRILVASITSVMALSAVLTLPTATPAQTVKKWKAPARAARKKNPVVATPKSIRAGEKIFQQMCAVCHGAKAKGARNTPRR